MVGGGNVAMDAVRTAKRLGAEATFVYRRSEKELPARAEEVHHAKNEEMCRRAVGHDGSYLQSVPERWKTPELCICLLYTSRCV